MKICKKCSKEFKEDYIYCPKCGTPYDVKIKSGKISWDTFLYGFGGLLILAYISSFKDDIVSSIFAILFGLSLFKIFYTIVGNKFTHIDEKNIKIARVVIPIILLVIWMFCTPAENINEEKNEQPSNIVENNEQPSIAENNENNISDNNSNKEENIKKEEEKIDNTEKNEKPKKTVYHIKFNELGNYGKYMEYEKENVIFYYLPAGKYKIEATNLSENICFLWIDYRKGYQNGNYGTAYNNKERLKFTKSSKSNTTTLDDSVHIYNSNDCDYKFTLID